MFFARCATPSVLVRVERKFAGSFDPDQLEPKCAWITPAAADLKVPVRPYTQSASAGGGTGSAGRYAANHSGSMVSSGPISRTRADAANAARKAVPVGGSGRENPFAASARSSSKFDASTAGPQITASAETKTDPPLCVV